MKILLLVSSMHAGGAERVAATLVNAWSARGDTVILVPTYSAKGNCFYSLSPSVKLIWLADRMSKWALFKPFSYLAKLWALRHLVRAESPQVIVSFLTNVNLTTLIATAGMRLPVIVCERTYPENQDKGKRIWRWLRPLFYPYASAVLVQTQDAASMFNQQMPGLKQVAVIPNPLPNELLIKTPLFVQKKLTSSKFVGGFNQTVDLKSPTHPSPMAGNPPKRIVAMGRLMPKKQFDVLINIFAALAPLYLDWEVWIWGEGPQRQALQIQIKNKGLEQRIHLPGQTNTPWEALAEAEIFVSCSALEGFPNVLLEAMALGLPCVTVDCPSGPRDMTRNGLDAMLIPMDAVADLQNALQQLMSDQALRDQWARQAIQVRQRYSLPQVLACWDELFLKVRRPTN